MKCNAAGLSVFVCRRYRRPRRVLTTVAALAGLAWGSTPLASPRCIRCLELPAPWPRQQRQQQLAAPALLRAQLQRRQGVLHQPPAEGTCSLASPTACHLSTLHALHACWRLAPPCFQPLSSSNRLGHHTSSSSSTSSSSCSSSSSSLLHGRRQTSGTRQVVALSSRCQQTLPPPAPASHPGLHTC